MWIKMTKGVAPHADDAVDSSEARDSTRSAKSRTL